MRDATTIILGLFLTCLLHSCGLFEPDKQDYIDKFNENSKTFDTLAQFLLKKYGSDDNSVRLKIVDPKRQQPTHLEQVDPEIQELLDRVKITEIHFENGNSVCDNIYRFDKIYFKYDKEGTIVSYIYSVCLSGPFDYHSQTIENKTIKDHWELLIDSNFP